MEKYGVDEKTKEKTATASAACPRCGASLTHHGEVKLCPNCGSEPFEEESSSTAVEQGRSIPGDTVEE